MNIKIIGKNSSNKIKLNKNIKKSIENSKLDYIPTIEDINDNQNYKNTPVLIINDKIISEGKVLTEREISRYIKDIVLN